MTPVHPDTLAALTSGIQSEVASYVFYVEAAKRSDMNEIKTVLEELALEEKEHFHVLERQYDSLIRSEKWISTADILKQEGLPEIGEDMTREHQALIDEVDRAESPATVLDIAFRLEEEANQLFSDAAKRAESAEGKNMFERLARFEEGHMNKIRELQEEMD
jgi:rubrerythrin